MELVTDGALSAGWLVWQPRRDAAVLTVAAKITFTLAPRRSALSEAPEPLARVDLHVQSDAAQSLWLAKDLVPAKPQVDVTLVGHAYAPERRPVASLVARLSLGSISKAIEVVQERAVGADGVVHPGAAFAKMSLGYERAAGGPGTANPVGLRRDVRDAHGRRPLPNLQPPGAGPEGHVPVGFGPIAASWPERRERLGAHAAAFAASETALPDGFDLAFFNAAPRDQQIRALSPDQSLVLEHLHPEHALLATSLPAIAPIVVVEGRSAGAQPLAMRADTLWIDTDRGLATVTFRGSLALSGAGEGLRIVASLPPAASARRDGDGRIPSPAKKIDFTAEIPLAFRTPGALPFQATPGSAPLVVAPPVIAPLVVAPHAPAAAASPWAVRAEPGDQARPMDALAPSPERVATSPALAVAASPAPRAPSSPPAVNAAEAMELVWLDLDSVPRMRRKPEFRSLLDALEAEPLDPELDDPAVAPNPMTLEDRRDAFHILARGAAVSAEGIAEAHKACVRRDGKFVPTIVLAAGPLEMELDAIAELEATVAIAAPLAGQDDAIRGALAAAKEFLAAPATARPLSIAASLTTRIEETVAQNKRVTAPQFAVHRERVLLEHRRYRVRSVFGGPHLAGAIEVGGRGSSTPAFFPEEAAPALPLALRFRARLVAEVRPPVDPREAPPRVLRVLAVGRLL